MDISRASGVGCAKAFEPTHGAAIAAPARRRPLTQTLLAAVAPDTLSGRRCFLADGRHALFERGGCQTLRFRLVLDSVHSAVRDAGEIFRLLGDERLNVVLEGGCLIADHLLFEARLAERACDGGANRKADHPDEKRLSLERLGEIALDCFGKRCGALTD